MKSYSSKKLFVWISMFLAMALILSACAPAATPAATTAAPAETAAATEATTAATEATTPEATAAVTAEATATELTTALPSTGMTATEMATSTMPALTATMPATTTATITAPLSTAMVTGTVTAGEPTISLVTDPKLGKILVDGKGMTLYMFLKDTPGKSNCTGACAQLWPPLLSTGGAPVAGTGVDPKLLGTAKLADGTLIVTYNNMPLYYYAKDTKPGDVTGQGVGGVWFVMGPTGAPVGAPAASPTKGY